MLVVVEAGTVDPVVPVLLAREASVPDGEPGVVDAGSPKLRVTARPRRTAPPMMTRPFHVAASPLGGG